MGDDYIMDIFLYCFDDFEKSAFSEDITKAASFTSEFEVDHQFEEAYYDSRFNQMIIRKMALFYHCVFRRLLMRSS